MARITDPDHPDYRPPSADTGDGYADYSNPDPKLKMKEEIQGGESWSPDGRLIWSYAEEQKKKAKKGGRR